MSKPEYFAMKMKYELAETTQELEIPQLSKQEVLQLLKFKFDVSLNLIKDIRELLKTQGNEKAKEAEMWGQPIMADQFFL